MSDAFERGRKIRREVLGAAYVDRAFAHPGDFMAPFQDLVTRYCWGEIWGSEKLSRRERSMLNLAMLAALNRGEELKLHTRAAVTNGVTREEIQEIFLQVAVYAGIPAGLESFRIGKAVFAELEATAAGPGSGGTGAER